MFPNCFSLSGENSCVPTGNKQMTIPSEHISNGPLLQFCKVGQGGGEMPVKSLTGGVGTLFTTFVGTV